jgi:hypothetical protein
MLSNRELRREGKTVKVKRINLLLFKEKLIISYFFFTYFFFSLKIVNLEQSNNKIKDQFLQSRIFYINSIFKFSSFHFSLVRSVMFRG